MLIVEEYRDARDDVLCMKIKITGKCKISCMRDMRDMLADVINLSTSEIGNHTLIYATANSTIDKRTYIITLSDVNTLLRDKEVTVYSYKGSWNINK